MNPTIKFINENSVDECIKYIKDNNVNVEGAINKALLARKIFGLKTQELIEELEKLNVNIKYKKGMILEAKEDCMNNFRKG